jgi:hypothetical protein
MGVNKYAHAGMHPHPECDSAYLTATNSLSLISFQLLAQSLAARHSEGSQLCYSPAPDESAIK